MYYKKDLDEHDVNLNIHYTIPKELGDKVLDVFKSMPYWIGSESKNGEYLCWYDENDIVELYYSLEPSGIQIYGLMPWEIWRKWYPKLKRNLTEALGYEIGEPEEGYDFKYWNT